MVFAGEPMTNADKNVQFIAAKQHVIGIIAQCQLGFRTRGRSNNRAKQARQKAIAGPLLSTGHPLSNVVCVKNPLLLQSTAAATTNHTPGIRARIGMGSISMEPNGI
jgi:hypothetical protein